MVRTASPSTWSRRRSPAGCSAPGHAAAGSRRGSRRRGRRLRGPRSSPRWSTPLAPPEITVRPSAAASSATCPGDGRPVRTDRPRTHDADPLRREELAGAYREQDRRGLVAETVAEPSSGSRHRTASRRRIPGARSARARTPGWCRPRGGVRAGASRPAVKPGAPRDVSCRDREQLGGRGHRCHERPERRGRQRFLLRLPETGREQEGGERVLGACPRTHRGDHTPSRSRPSPARTARPARSPPRAAPLPRP